MAADGGKKRWMDGWIEDVITSRRAGHGLVGAHHSSVS